MISLKVSELPFDLGYAMHPDAKVYVCMSDCGSLMIENQYGQHIEDFEPNLFEEDWFNNLPKDRFFELEETQVKYTTVGELRKTSIPVPDIFRHDKLVELRLNNIVLVIIIGFRSDYVITTDEIRNDFNNICVVLNH